MFLCPFRKPTEHPTKFMDNRQRAYDQGLWELRSTAKQLQEFHTKFTVYDTDKKLIRVGGLGDGGYLIPDDIEGISAVFSPGVAAVAEFEKYFADKGITCFLADASVNEAPVKHQNFTFMRKFVHAGETEGDWKNFEEWVEESVTEHGDLLLQMDIEGGEWEILDDLSTKNLCKFRIIVLELHGMHQLAYKLAFQTIMRIFTKITEDFEIVHVHPNNAERALSAEGFKLAPLLEITLLRKDRIVSKFPVEALPKELDADNVASYPTVKLDPSWIKPLN